MVRRTFQTEGKECVKALKGKGLAESRDRNKTNVTRGCWARRGSGRRPEISQGRCGQVLGLDSKNNGKPGNGFKQGCAVVRFASLEEHPGCNAKKGWKEPMWV